jgi:hypothetical protein
MCTSSIVETQFEVNPVADPPIIPKPVHHKFAVRQHISILAVVCECGAVTHGRGLKKWTECPVCHAPVITSRDQRYRERHRYLTTDQFIYQRYKEVRP